LPDQIPKLVQCQALKIEFNVIMNNIFQIKTFTELAPGQFKKILTRFKPVTVKRNTFLLNEGEVCKKLYFVQKGVIRTFLIDKGGKEKTSSVMLENYFGTAWMSFITQQPSKEFIEATEHSSLFVLSYAEFHKLVNTDILWKDFYLKAIEFAFINQNRKVEALLSLNAQQRFQKLLNGNPALIQNVSNKVLASFLHMREETLSRIKSKK
jgi:CRP-like cAMP-binding protein